MSRVTFKEEAAAPPTPPAGYVVFYAKADSLLYFKDDTGTEKAVKPVGGGTGDLLSDGTVPLIANWDVGAFKIIALQLESDIVTGTAPFIVASTTMVTNLNAEKVGGSTLAQIQTLIDTAVAGLYGHKGGYDAATNTPDLDTAPTGIKKGDAYTVSVAGTFYAVAVEAGDVLIADIDNPVASTSWTIVNRNIDSSAFATAAQGATADAALPKAGGTMSGNIAMAGAETVDGRDVSADGTKLDGIEAAADVTDAANVAAAGAVMDGDFAAAEGFMRKTGAGAYIAHKSNLTAIVAPTVTDDSAAGYSVGSIWLDTVAVLAYTCTSAAVGAAVWALGGLSQAQVDARVVAVAPTLDTSRTIVTTTIADDSVWSWAFGVNMVGTLIIMDTATGGHRGLFAFRAHTSSPFCLSIAAIGVTGTTGILTGTTGADATVTISTHTDQTLYIENRSGGNLVFELTVNSGALSGITSP